MPPIKVSKITGLINHKQEVVEGHVLGIVMSPEQMTENRDQALKKIIQATKKAKKLGIGIMGLGAMTASFSKGGLDILEEVTEVGITTGRAYTTKTVTDYVKDVIERFSLPKEKVIVGVVGGAGSIGSSCAKVLHRWGIQHIVLIDMARKAETLHAHAKEMDKIRVDVSHDVNDIKHCDIIITATSAPEALITKDLVHPGMVIINDAQPTDIDIAVIKEREDVLVIEGGVVHTKDVHSNFRMGPRGKDENYCCLAEVLVLGHHGHFENYAIGNLDLTLVEHIEEKAKPLGFKIAKYQNFVQGYIPEEQVEKVGALLQKRISNRN